MRLINHERRLEKTFANNLIGEGGGRAGDVKESDGRERDFLNL